MSVGLLIVASLLVSVIHVPGHVMISPIDEYVYIDYLAKVPTVLVVRHGEQTGAYAREMLMCNGVRTLGVYPESRCETALLDEDASYPMGGTNSADIYTPAYFAATWLLAQPLQWFGIDLIDAGRYTGFVWLALAAVLLYLTLRRLKVRPALAFGLPLLVVGSLPAFWSNTYISTDATALLAGSLMAFLGVRGDERGRGTMWLLPAAASILTLLKLQNFGAVAVVALFLMIRAAWDALEPRKPAITARLVSWLRDTRTVASILALTVPMLLQFVWLFIRSLLAVGEGGDQGTASPFGPTQLLEEMLKFFVGPANGALDPSVFGVVGIILAAVVGWVSVGGVLGVIATSAQRSLGEAIGVSVLAVALTIGPALAVATIISTGYYFYLPTRYGISLIPIFFICAALVADRKSWVANGLMIVGVAGFSASLFIPRG
jgi:heme exporter protein D